MKKIFTLIMAISLASGIFAQKGDIPNATTLNFSWFRPTGVGNPYIIDAHSTDISSVRLNNEGISFGGSLSIGGMFFINKLDFVKGLRLGINADYFELSANGLYGEYLNADGDKFGDLHVKLSPKFGLQLSYSPIEIMKMDIFVRWAPMLGLNYFGDDNYYFNGDSYEDIALERSLKRISLGFNYRITLVVIGIEYIKGTTVTSLEDPSGFEYNSFSDNTLKVTLGFNFDKD